jgi:hypothetical protein
VRQGQGELRGILWIVELEQRVGLETLVPEIERNDATGDATHRYPSVEIEVFGFEHLSSR